MNNFDIEWQRCRIATEAALASRLPSVDESPETLHEAMRYSTLNGGKRLRGVLTIMTGEMLGTDTKVLLAPAAAMECIHAYSLVHDDLPCMDDDQYRRGKLSCFAAYDEATAVLVGDALQTLAFEILSSDESLAPLGPRKAELVRVLAQASGSRGMAGGQALDLVLNNANSIDLATVHRLKTAKLIQASVRLGALTQVKLSSDVYDLLSEFGELIGLSFQFKDDVLDEDHNVEYAKKQAEELRDQAISILHSLNYDTTNLEGVAKFIVARSY